VVGELDHTNKKTLCCYKKELINVVYDKPFISIFMTVKRSAVLFRDTGFPFCLF
jgi:hypothetical protein